MIQTLPDFVEEVVLWINTKFPEDDDVTLIILYGYDCIEVKDIRSIKTNEPNNMGWGLYDYERKRIYLADPQEIQNNLSAYINDRSFHVDYLECLFHEYKHHQQNLQGKPFDEDEAEEFAVKMRKQFLRERMYCEYKKQW